MKIWQWISNAIYINLIEIRCLLYLFFGDTLRYNKLLILIILHSHNSYVNNIELFGINFAWKYPPSLTLTIRLRTTTVHFFITVNDLRQHESGHFLTYGHFMSRPTAFHCRTPDLYWHFVIWLTSLKEIQTQFLSPRLFVQC